MTVGKKTSVWLSDDLAARVAESGVSLAALIRRGLDAGEPAPFEESLRGAIRDELEALLGDRAAAWKRVAQLIRDEVAGGCEEAHGGRDDTPARPRHAPAGQGDAPEGPSAQPGSEGSRMPGDPSADGTASPQGAQRPGRRVKAKDAPKGGGARVEGALALAPEKVPPERIAELRAAALASGVEIVPASELILRGTVAHIQDTAAQPARSAHAPNCKCFVCKPPKDKP